MSRIVVHRTPGVLDLRSFTTFGVNAKPNSVSPFGYFGTGLKYAIAILVREGIPVSVMTDLNVYSFYKEKSDFRGKEFELVRMRRENRSQQPFLTSFRDLPYTTELGKNWKLWQVFRELHSNTMDEGGVTYVVNSASELEFCSDETAIVVESEEYAEIYDNRHEIFLPDGLREARSSERIQVLDRPSDYVFYRGVRVLDLKKPSRMTYNFLQDVELTEDRTAKNPFILEMWIRRMLATTEEETLAVKAATADPDSFEGSLDYDYDSVAPSQTFVQAVRAAPLPAPAAHRLITAYEPRRRVEDPLEEVARPLRLTTGLSRVSVVDQEGTVLFLIPDESFLSDRQYAYLVALMNEDLGSSALEEFAEEYGYEET